MTSAAGGQLVAESLAEQEVEYIFTLSGGHITPIYQYLENTPVKLFDTRHEQAAVFMAEAWGKMTRRSAAALVTAGPGFTNSLTAASSAFFSNTPLVLIAGCVGLHNKEKLDLQDMPQASMISPIVKKALVCRKTERIPEYVDMAFRTASSGRPGPVYLEFPVDVLNNEVERSCVKKIKTSVSSRPADPESARSMLEMIRQAEKPVVIAGSGVWQAEAEKELVEFIEKTGMPVFTSLSGRGAIPDDHPLCFEGALAIRPGAAFAAYIEADLFIILGTRISFLFMFGEVLNPEAKMVQVDIEPEEIGRNRTVDLPVSSDIKAYMKCCSRIIEQEGGPYSIKDRFSGWVEKLKEAEKDGREQSEKDWQSGNKPIHPLRLAREIDAFMNREDDIVVADGGDTSTWMGMTRRVNTPGSYLDYGIFGSLAVGLPYANAAKLKYPGKRVLLVSGDGSIGFNFMEFESAIRKGLNIVAVICNDLGWGMIRHSQELRMGRAIETGTYLGRVDYHKMVEAIGGRGFLVENPEDIKPALEEAFASGRVCCINVMTDPTTVSPGSVALANIGAYKA